MTYNLRWQNTSERRENPRNLGLENMTSEKEADIYKDLHLGHDLWKCNSYHNKNKHLLSVTVQFKIFSVIHRQGLKDDR